MSDQDGKRSTREVIEAHLRCREEGDLEGDLRRNYAPGVLLMSAEGIHRGHDGVRKLAEILHSYAPDHNYIYGRLLAEGELAQLTWHTDGEDVEVHDGADTFVVREGRIAAQTIHYSTRPSFDDG